MRPLLLFVLLVLVACGRAVKEAPPIDTAAAAMPDPSEQTLHWRLPDLIPRRCAKLDRQTFRGQEPAQGPIAAADIVGEERGKQVKELSGQLAEILAALKKKGCVELKR